MSDTQRCISTISERCEQEKQMTLNLYVQSSPQLHQSSSVKGRLTNQLPVACEIYVPMNERQERFAAIALKRKEALVLSPCVFTPPHWVVASLQSNPPQYIDRTQCEPSTHAVINYIHHTLFLASHQNSDATHNLDSSSSLSLIPLRSYQLPLWSSVRLRILSSMESESFIHSMPTLTNHAPVCIQTRIMPHELAVIKPSLASIKAQLLDKPMFVQDSSNNFTSRLPILILFLDGQYRAVEFVEGQYSSVYKNNDSLNPENPLYRWGICTLDTQIEWANFESTPAIPTTSASASSPVSPINLSISELFQHHLPSFDEESSSASESDVKNFALLFKLFKLGPSSSSLAFARDLLHPNSTLLSGSSGLGKRTLVSSLARLFHLRVEHVSFASLILMKNVRDQTESLKSTLANIRAKYLRKVTAAATQTQPVVVVFHSLEMIFASSDERDQDAINLQAEFLHFMHEINATHGQSNVLVVGLTHAKKLLSTQLIKAFQFQFQLTYPSNDGRRRILQTHLGVPVVNAADNASSSSAAATTVASSQSTMFECNQVDFAWLVEQTQGFVGADLVALIKSAVSHAVGRTQPMQANTRLQMLNLDFEFALQRIRAASMKSLNVVVKPRQQLVAAPSASSPTATESSSESVRVPPQSIVTKTKFEGVGGLHSVKSQLYELLEGPFLHRAHYKALGIQPSKGILLYGVPGVGKTLLSRMIAAEFRANFLSIHLSQLLKSGVGESEKFIAELFAQAKKIAPSIIFLDEIQAVFHKSNAAGQNELAQKMMAQLLFQIDALHDDSTADGTANASEKQVMILAATNLPSSLDPSLLRAGRIDQALYVGPPDANARREILFIAKKQAKWSEEVLRRMDEIIARTAGYSAVDVVHLVGRAGFYALQRHPTVVPEELSVEFSDFDQAINSMTSSITPNMIRICERFQQKQKHKMQARKKRMVDVLGNEHQ